MQKTLIYMRTRPVYQIKHTWQTSHPLQGKTDLWMLADNKTYCQTESDMSTPWSHKPTLDYGTLVRHTQTIPPNWLYTILTETARRCLIRAGDTTTSLEIDSSGVETSRLSGPASGFCPDTPKDILTVPYGSHFGSTDSVVCSGNTVLCQRYYNAI
ncbi:MAG: hypothetical protein F4245_06940 [Cenarchaeum sp. SB0678_bin_8]|nr:hypothetical protein [Cenarchaeum sp. SB0666_bin_15]MYD59329.1 hypothetical protein [Cenarchaeum sp. SB0678_bin_8]